MGSYNDRTPEDFVLARRNVQHVAFSWQNEKNNDIRTKEVENFKRIRGKYHDNNISGQAKTKALVFSN